MIPHNIEKSAFRPGEYIGYGMAGVTSYRTRIKRGGEGWRTYYDDQMSREAGGCFSYMTARTLEELGAQLEGRR